MVEGRTNRDRLESRLERAIRKEEWGVVEEIEAELMPPPFPAYADHAWQVWRRLRRRMGMGQGGPEPFAWRDMESFLSLSGLSVDPIDIELIELLDDIYLTTVMDGATRKSKQQALKDSVKALGKSGG